MKQGGQIIPTGMLRSDGLGGIEREYIRSDGTRFWSLSSAHKALFGFSPDVAVNEHADTER